jgi:hypothetical protein
LLGGHVEEHLEVLTELLFHRGRRLRTIPEEYGHHSEVLAGPFGNGSLVKIVDYATAALARGHCHRLHAEHMVEPRLLVLKSLLSLVQIIEVGLLSLTAVLVRQRVAASENVS